MVVTVLQPNPAVMASTPPVMQGPMLSVDAADHLILQQQFIADTEHAAEVC